MKLKHLLLAVTTASLVLSASAANPNATVSQVRIYINPGHGTYTSSDRPMATIKHGAAMADTAGFYESNTNMQKAYGLLDKLKEYGVPYDASKAITGTNQTNIRMSHATTGISPGLTTVAEEAQTMNADMFISIHSNANQGDGNNPSGHTNFNQLLFLHRGWDGDPYVAGSYDMAMACWKHAISNKHMHWNWLNDVIHPYEEGSSNYVNANGNKCTSFPGRVYYPSGKDADGNPYWIKGDVKFQYNTDRNNSSYTRFYGVLNHTIPGFLVEGYDHTYRPAMHRAMNDDVCRHEGEMYARGINDYFGWGIKDSYGKIYGIVRDQSVTMNHTYWSVIQNPTRDANKYIDQVDNKKPLNNVTVTLYNSNGVAVDTYTTDDEWNGAYFFKKVAPGTYTIKHSLSGYKEVTQEVTVVANETNYIDIDMRTAPEGNPVQGHYAYGLSLAKTDDYTYTATFSSTGAMDNGKIILTNSSTKEQTVIETGAINKGTNSVAIDASKLGEGVNYSWAVAFDNPQSTGYELIHSDNSITYNNGSANARIGITIDNDETSAHFGTIYTMTAMGQGLQKFNPDFSKNGSKILTGIFGQDASSSTSSNKYVRSNRLTINSGKVYIANFAAQNPGVWVYNPSAGSTATQMLTGGDLASEYIRGVDFIGSGSSRVMYTFNELGIKYFNIGTSDSWTATSPSGSYSTTSIGMTNCDGDLFAANNGLFASQIRYNGNNVSGNPCFKVFAPSGTALFSSETLSSTLTGTQRGGMAINSDLTTFAIVDGWEQTSDYKGIEGDIEIDVYNVTWSGNTPSFSHSYTIPLGGTHQVDQMEFDHAGNLYIASQQQGLLVYAVKNPSRQTTTNGAGTITGVKPIIPLYIVGNSDAVGNWDPAKAVEFTDNGTNYTITLDENTTEFKISTGKGDISGDWTEFDAGNLTTDEAIENGKTINLTAQWGGNFVLPWAGVWNITVAGDLSTLTATTSTPKPLDPLYIVGNSDAIGAGDPTNAVEVSNDGTNYSITLDENVTEFKISTNKGDWETFNNGNLTPTTTISNVGTVNLVADKDGGYITLPWEGVWNITVAGDLTTLTATTTTPNPNQGPGIGAEPEDAPNPDAEPDETEEAEDAQTEGYFAYALSSSKSGNEYTFSFKSTGARKNGRIVLTNTSTGATTEIKTAIVKGQNTVKVNAYDIAKGSYTWAVKMTNNANSTVTQVGSVSGVASNGVRLGLTIDNDQTSANFGTVYTITGKGIGAQKYYPDLSANGSKYMVNQFAGTRSNYSIRLKANSGKLYIASYDNDGNQGLWVCSSTTPSKMTISSNIQAGVRGVDFNGTGSNRKMYLTSYTTFHGYNIGTSDAGTSTATSYSTVGDNLVNEGDVLTTDKGIFVSQKRYNGGNTEDYPIFRFVDYSGNILFSGHNLNGNTPATQVGAMAITSDKKIFAIIDGWNADSGGNAIEKEIEVDIYNVSWNGSTPSFSYQYSIPLSGTKQVDQMAFDHAGNLYLVSLQKGLLKYAVKTSARATTTNALTSYTVTGLGRDVAPSNVVATRKCNGEGSNTTAGTVDANITWTGEAGEFKVYYQTMRRDESGNRVYDNNGTWEEAGTATIASGSTSGSFTHKNLEPGDGYNRIYNYKVANYYSEASYVSEVKSKSISGKGHTVTSAAPVVPVNVVLSQPSTVVDGVTQYSLDLKLDLSLNEDVFNSTLLDDNDELVTATKYVIVVDEATAKALNAASNKDKVGRFYQGPATMTANNCNHFTINDWYMVVDFEDITPSGDLSKATKTLTWEDVDLTMTYKPQVYTSAVRTFNFNANSAESAAYKITLPTPQWTATNSTEDEGGNVTNNVEIIPVTSTQLSTIVGAEDMPIGSFRKVGDTENATNAVAITQANVIGITGAIEPLPASDDVLNKWDITYTFQIKDAQGNVVYTSQQESRNNTTNANLYSNTKKVMIDVLGIPVGYDATTALDGRARYVYNAEKNSNYKLVVITTYSKEVDGETVEYSNESEADIVVSPTFPAPAIDAYKSPGFLFLETSTHWDEDCPNDAANNYGYYKYYYDAAVDIAWNDFEDNLVRYMGYHATPKFDCVGHPDGSSSEWVPYHAASVLTDDQVAIYNTRKGTKSESVLAGIGYTGSNDWSSLAVAEGHLPLKVHYVWAGSNPISEIGDAKFDFELSANYPIVTMATPEIKINETTVNGAYDLVLANPLSRSTSGNDLIMITTVNNEFKTLVMDGIIDTPTTGVENVGVGNGTLRLYPNPANSVVTLQAPITITDVKIFTIDGQLVKEYDTNDTKVKINVSDLTTGVYIVHAAGTTTRMIKK